MPPAPHSRRIDTELDQKASPTLSIDSAGLALASAEDQHLRYRRDIGNALQSQ